MVRQHPPLAGSLVRITGLAIFPSDTSVATGDGTAAIPITEALIGKRIIGATAIVHTKGITGTTEVQIRRRRAGSDVDVLSTKVTIGNEWFASDGVVNASNADIQEGDALYADVDLVHSGTPPKGLSLGISAL